MHSHIHFFVGTKAQLIKMAPLMVELRSRYVPYRHIDTGQHYSTTRKIQSLFQLDEPDYNLRGESSDIVSMLGAFSWFIGLILRGFFQRKWLRREVFPGGGVCLIHGDTLSTLLGLYLAKWAGLRVAHVEAGLRSHRLFDPFPEEMIRIICMRRADILFAPSEEAATNLRVMQVKGGVIEISGNTVIDSLRLVENSTSNVLVPSRPYALATCHRLETITNKERLTKVVRLLNRVAEAMPVALVIHAPTRRRLEKYRLLGCLHENILQQGLLNYADFVVLLKNAAMVLTDGGSIQEECAALGKPCLILRNATERSDGLGANARLWHFDDSISDAFLNDAIQKKMQMKKSKKFPSREIVDYLRQTEA